MHRTGFIPTFELLDALPLPFKLKKISSRPMEVLKIK
jgi:hypothetical protein